MIGLSFGLSFGFSFGLSYGRSNPFDISPSGCVGPPASWYGRRYSIRLESNNLHTSPDESMAVQHASTCAPGKSYTCFVSSSVHWTSSPHKIPQDARVCPAPVAILASPVRAVDAALLPDSSICLHVALHTSLHLGVLPRLRTLSD